MCKLLPKPALSQLRRNARRSLPPDSRRNRRGGRGVREQGWASAGGSHQEAENAHETGGASSADCAAAPAGETGSASSAGSGSSATSCTALARFFARASTRAPIFSGVTCDTSVSLLCIIWKQHVVLYRPEVFTDRVTQTGKRTEPVWVAHCLQ